MNTFLKVGMAASGALAIAFVVTFATGRSSIPAAPVPPSIGKSDRLKDPERITVRTVPIVPTPAPTPEPAPVPVQKPKAEPVVKEATVEEERPRRRGTRSERRSRRDVCSRHNMRKVMVGRYRWRCRK
jgi:hypothetical protein